MADVFVVSDHILSPVGDTTADNFARLKQRVSGIKQHWDKALANEPFYGSLFAQDRFSQSTYTQFEQMLISSIGGALQNTGINPGDSNIGLIISSTKGNISLLETEVHTPALNDRIALHTSGKLVGGYFGFVNQPIVVSNACISGILGMITAMRMIRSGQYETVIVSGADVISKFVLSGFQSFNAISSKPCKPFDAERDGITLGEAAATIILSSNPKYANGIRLMGGATSNDANHISAPSRTGAELNQAITSSLNEAGLTSADISFISAHGTATVYNDEMEAKALTLANLQSTPLNSLKGYYGHTLGAAGLIESIISIECLKENLILPTIGFEHIGVPTPVNVCKELTFAPLKHLIKTASGFGGCNGAIIFSKPD
ncbi:beta-ketoacyl-[acyl-carrier-protein] synthase family protein [Mucilaginibacter paludis]|uniref:Beta-ketoacyl synthase n=1 Tax=Mucilaginibacter paludis DSM 18603 TaxID=714943 RepID=H1Y1H8_9SPHI|nr:beta-ketoacyl synthase N-terminal-like domain-containing protein [Mucilaginibacter paludis]EHQ30852.1 Beta-ketoacyl synthase [Mucilaginibacter paludis DSM 18603]